MADNESNPKSPTGSEGDADDGRGVDVVRGNAVVPDAEQAPESEDLKPDDPPAGAPVEGDPAKKTAVAAPMPAHGEMASREQIEEATRAAEEEGGEA